MRGEGSILPSLVPIFALPSVVLFPKALLEETDAMARERLSREFLVRHAQIEEDRPSGENPPDSSGADPGETG